MSTGDFITKIVPMILMGGITLCICYAIISHERKDRMMREVCRIADGKLYQCLLKIKLKDGKEEVAVVGYSNEMHSVKSFIENCKWIEDEETGLSISEETKCIYIPKKSIQKMTITKTLTPTGDALFKGGIAVKNTKKRKEET